MNDISLIFIMLLPSCLAIAVIDKIIFSKWTECPNCKHRNNEWYSFLLPTIIEILLFLSGVAIGISLKWCS